MHEAEALQYDVDALKVGIEKCRNSIKIFDDAIQKELSTIREYQEMIAVLESRQHGTPV